MRPRANISSALSIDAPAAPRTVLCPIATSLRSSIGSVRTRPTTTAIPFPAFTSRLGCGRSFSIVTITALSGALGSPSPAIAPFHERSASIAASGVARDASFTDMHAVCPCSTATRFTCALTRMRAGVTAPCSKVPRILTASMAMRQLGNKNLYKVLQGMANYLPSADSVEVGFEPIDESTLAIEAIVKVFGRTGVEMEALTAVSVAALTVYDMCKAIDRSIVIDRVRLEEKSGGRNGTYRRDSSEPGSTP